MLFVSRPFPNLILFQILLFCLYLITYFLPTKKEVYKIFEPIFPLVVRIFDLECHGETCLKLAIVMFGLVFIKCKLLKSFFWKDNSISIILYTLFFYIRTSKFCLRLAVLIFFHFSDWNVLNLFLFPQLNLAIPQRMPDSTIKTHYFISFIPFLSSSAYRRSCEVFYKKSVLQLC